MELRRASRMALATPSFIRESLKLAADPSIISFAGGNPDPDYFPWQELEQATAAALADDWKSALQYSVTEGNLPLRRLLQARMAAIGVTTPLEQLVITSGSQQGLDMVAKIFLDPGDKVLVESPTYMGAINAFKYYQPRFVEVAMDSQGMRIDALAAALAANPDAKFIYTIPDFQNPTGLTLAEERRPQLVELAERYDVMILEDNPYFHLRFSGRRIPPLKHYDKYNRVIYLGSVSKVLCPALRVGWAVAGDAVIQSMVYLKQAADLHTNELAQRSVAQYLGRFDLDAHIATINRAYQAKKDLMLELIRKRFPPEIACTEPEGGLFLWLTFPEGCDTQAIFHRALAEQRVIFVPGDTFYPYGGHANTARISYATVSLQKIEEGMERLARLLHDVVK